MNNRYLISEDDLGEIEKAVRYIREDKYDYPMNQIDRIERIINRIRNSDNRKREALQTIVDALKPILVVDKL